MSMFEESLHLENIEPSFNSTETICYERYLPMEDDSPLQRDSPSHFVIEESCSVSSKEQKRLNSINRAFEQLRRVIPTFPFEKRLTKIETLKLAISYILMLDNVLASEQAPSEFIYDVLKGYHNSAPWYTHELSARLNWLRWENLGMV